MQQPPQPQSSRGRGAGSNRPKEAPLTMSSSRFLGAASRAHDAGDLPAAITLYTTAIQLDPTSVQAFIGRGVAHKEQKEFDRALADYTRALQLSPSDSVTLVVLSNRANVYSALGDSAAALVDHNSALSLNRHDPVLWTNRGSTLLKLARLDDARADFEAALQMDNTYAVAWYNLGLCHGRQGAIGACVDDFNRAARLFEQSKSNQSHAQDCYRQIQLFTGMDPQRASGGSRASGSLSSSLEITPISPSHARGITRTNGALLLASTSTSSPSLTPAGTPSSRRPFHSSGDVSSDAFGPDDLAAATLPASVVSAPAVVAPAAFTDPVPLLRFQSAHGRDPRSVERAFSFTRNLPLQSDPASSRSRAASGSATGASASSAAAPAAPVYSLARPPSLSGSLSHSCVVPSQSPRTGDSFLSPDSFDPLLSPTAQGLASASRKKPLTPIKPNVTHVRLKTQTRPAPSPL